MAVKGVRGAVTALQVLEAIGGQQPIGVRELARQLEMSKSSVQRSLETLHLEGWIRPHGGEQTKWVLTSKVMRVARNAGGELGVRNVAVPVMEELRSATQETIHLGVPEGDTVVLIERLDSPQAVRTHIPLGLPAPIEASAVGKAILSTWSTEMLVSWLSDRTLSAYTDNTNTNADDLLREVNQVRQQGYSINDEEWRDGVTAVASPIVDSDGQGLAGLSISAPAQRMTKELHSEYGASVRAAAREISQRLSG